MKNYKIVNWLETEICKQGSKDFFDMLNNCWEEYSDEIKTLILDDVFSQLKPEKIETIEDLAKLLNGNKYCDELKNPYNLDVEKICKDNKWIILFPYSDDCLEVRGYIDDEIGAWDDTNYKIVKKGEFYEDRNEDNTYHKATKDGLLHTEEDPHIFMKWCPEDKSYIWYIESNYPNVAYFDIDEEDVDENKIWARCCIIDCSEIL